MNNQDTTNSLVELADSHVTQHTSGHIKSDWSVFTAGNDKVLQMFPNTHTEQDIFRIMDFAKEYELKALNAGIAFQKDKQNLLLANTIAEYKKITAGLMADNERLAAALEKEMFKRIVEE